MIDGITLAYIVTACYLWCVVLFMMIKRVKRERDARARVGRFWAACTRLRRPPEGRVGRTAALAYRAAALDV